MLTKEIQKSDLLLNTLGGDATCSRPELTRQLWKYIKANKLQDPTDGRQIINDSAFRDIFECDQMTMFQMTKLVQKHIIKL